jgi:hypothetical protein
MEDDALQQSLLAIERKGWDALCASTGDTFYGALMTKDAVMVLANGAVMDTSAVVEALGQAPPWRTYEISDVRLVRTGTDSSALVYTGTAYREAAEPAFVGMMSSVYVRDGEDWRLALYQQTELPGEAE